VDEREHELVVGLIVVEQERQACGQIGIVEWLNGREFGVELADVSI
jgi:hypothetical protein